MATGLSTAWDVKVFLRDKIMALRAQGKTWPQVQSNLGPTAWQVWLMVQNVAPQQTTLRAAQVTHTVFSTKAGK